LKLPSLLAKSGTIRTLLSNNFLVCKAHRKPVSGCRGAHIILALGRLRQEDLELEVSLGQRRPCLKKDLKEMGGEWKRGEGRGRRGEGRGGEGKGGTSVSSQIYKHNKG
jgi:hypothetical protein